MCLWKTKFAGGGINSMARTPQDITDAELSIMTVLWDRGRQTIRQLTDSLYPDGSSVHYATVQKLLERLEKKDCVRRDRQSWPHQFEPGIERGDLIGRRLQATADQLCAGSLQPLLTHLVKERQMSDTERESLRSLLDELDRSDSSRN